MFGECHAHVLMDGINYREAVNRHKEKPEETAVRSCLAAYRKAGVTFVRDGGDNCGVSLLAKKLRRNTESIIVLLCLPSIRKVITEVLWEKASPI